MELENKQKSVSEKFKALTALEPKPVAGFVAADAEEQKQMFLRNEIMQPRRNYDRLDAIDFEQRKADIEERGARLVAHPDINPKFQAGYNDFVQTYLQRTEFMACAWKYNHAVDADAKAEAAREYMMSNIDIYGSPNESTYRSLLSEKIAMIRSKNLTGRAKEIADELVDMVKIGDGYPERYKPSDETVEWMHDVAESLYDGMLSHVPDQAELSVSEMQEVFTTIIEQEFGEAAAGWRVVTEKAKVVNVKATEKKVVVPENKDKRYKAETVRKLIVHELGVHMLRAINGSEVDFNPLETGLPNYLDAEEGLGKVMEQALLGKYEEAGVGHYITTGLAYHDSKNFREIFDVKWRLDLLENLDESSEIADKLITEKQRLAYDVTDRIMRGTDDLPWFKDLSYYNGTKAMWQHLEAIRGDHVKFMFVLMGKANPADIHHERVMYESRTV